MAEGGGRHAAAAADLAAENQKKLLHGHGGGQGALRGVHGGPKTVRFANRVSGEPRFQGAVEDVGGGIWAAEGWADNAAV